MEDEQFGGKGMGSGLGGQRIYSDDDKPDIDLNKWKPAEGDEEDGEGENVIDLADDAKEGGEETEELV